MPSRTRREWSKNTLGPAVQRSPERQPGFATSSGTKVEPLYTPEDLTEFDYGAALGFPGEPPFTRGIQPGMYRSRLWTMRQYSGFASAEETNRRFQFLLREGQTGLSIAFDLPTQIGYDSDDPLAQGEVGKVGVPVNSLEDMEILFRGIPLDRVSASMTINSTAPILLAMHVAIARKQGAPLASLEGTIQNDILKEYIARGTYIFPPRPSLRLTTDIFKFCGENLPRWNTISVSGYHMREAGATAAQELGFTLADGIAYVEAAASAGLDVDAFAGRLSFFFGCHNNFFEEIAKFRAARRLWAEIMKVRFGASDPRSWMLRFHTQTCGSTLTAQQPQNNIVRTSLQALAAVLGGTQSLHTNSWDEAYAPPTEGAVTTALRTQQIIAWESGAADTVDPMGGSYYLEHLTGSLEKEARRYIEEIDGMGGALAAIEKGYQQRRIQESAYSYQMEIERRRQTVVGVNKYASAQPEITGLLKVDPAAAGKHADSLARLRQERDNARVQAVLRQLETVASGAGNTMPAILSCVESYATLGEICGVLRRVFGEQQTSLESRV
ncbi:MAG: methylmalonyl-CoA mutase family protein [Chloroflexi bacterium]|nr:methylmalonyl-CoA mutase family protein [Chloroflexota bacterium]